MAVKMERVIQFIRYCNMSIKPLQGCQKSKRILEMYGVNMGLSPWLPDEVWYGIVEFNVPLNTV